MWAKYFGFGTTIIFFLLSLYYIREEAKEFDIKTKIQTNKVFRSVGQPPLYPEVEESF